MKEKKKKNLNDSSIQLETSSNVKLNRSSKQGSS